MAGEIYEMYISSKGSYSFCVIYGIVNALLLLLCVTLFSDCV